MGQLVLGPLSQRMKNVQKPVPYPATSAAIDALSRGEIDCVFPVNLSYYDGEVMDLLIINDIMQTEMCAIVGSANHENAITADRDMTVALLAGDTDTETFLKDSFPKWKTVIYAGVDECFQAVTSGAADCVVVNSHRINAVENLRERYNFSLVPTGETMGMSFAVRRSDHELYTVLNKIADLTSDGEVNAYLSSHADVQEMTMSQFLRAHWAGVLVFMLVVFAVILILLLQRMNAERKAYEHQRQMEAERFEHQRLQEEARIRDLERQAQLALAKQKAYSDSLTGMKSKHAYAEAEQQMEQKIADGTMTEFSVGIFDVNDLKKVNDTQGHDAGDKFIKEACQYICECFKRSPVYRIGGDEFSVILEGDDYREQEKLLREFEARMEENLRQGKRCEKSQSTPRCAFSVWD